MRLQSDYPVMYSQMRMISVTHKPASMDLYRLMVHCGGCKSTDVDIPHSLQLLDDQVILDDQAGAARCDTRNRLHLTCSDTR